MSKLPFYLANLLCFILFSSCFTEQIEATESIAIEEQVSTAGFSHNESEKNPDISVGPFEVSIDDIRLTAKLDQDSLTVSVGFFHEIALKGITLVRERITLTVDKIPMSAAEFDKTIRVGVFIATLKGKVAGETLSLNVKCKVRHAGYSAEFELVDRDITIMR